MGKMILIASGKGGTGKTTMTSHIGAKIAAEGFLTALVDADVGFRNLDIALGMESSVVYDYSDYINGGCELDDVLIKSSDSENLYFVAAPQSVSTIEFDHARTAEFWDSLKRRFEIVLADAPAGMGDGFMFAAKYADEAVVVCHAEASSLRDADRVVAELEELGIDTVRLILNRMDPKLVEQKVLMNVDDCIDVLSVPILGIVPEDSAVTVSMINGTPNIAAAGYGAGTAFENIARRILGNEVQMMDFPDGKKQGLLKKLKDICIKK